MRIIIIGAGAWGTALAIKVAKNPEVKKIVLWTKNKNQAQNMLKIRENIDYLPNFQLPINLEITNQLLSLSIKDKDLIIIATPTSTLREILIKLKIIKAPIIWLCKGFEESGMLAHEIANQIISENPFGILSGPSFAQEVVLDLPTCLVVTSKNKELKKLVIKTFHFDNLRVYDTEDLIGVEVGGAVKNVLAIATGLCDGLNLGMNARAALLTRGLSEMTRLGLALGAKQETFMGLTGIGDLILTATGDLSRNRQVGLMLAQGKELNEIINSLGHVAEGVKSSKSVLKRAKKLNIEMPITQILVSLLDNQINVNDAVNLLMNRQQKSEKIN